MNLPNIRMIILKGIHIQNAKMQSHHGSRLKNFIEKSHLKIKVISEKSGIATSSLHDLYKKEEITRKRIQPILDVLAISADDFFSPNKPGTVKQTESESLKREIELLKEQVHQLKEIIVLMKGKKGQKS